jgi:hypothetical protein
MKANPENSVPLGGALGKAVQRRSSTKALMAVVGM